MRAFAAFIVYLVASLLIASLLAYPFCLALCPVTDISVYDLVTRGAELVAAVGAVFLLGYFALNDKAALGYARARALFCADMLTGLVAGIAILLPLILTLMALHVRVWDPNWTFSWSGLATSALAALLSGVLIALIEETYFRGVMFTAIARQSGLWPAAILTSLLYASLHFVRTDYAVASGQLHWYSGFIVLVHALEPFLDPAAIVDSFLALFAVGLFLALVRAKTGHIATCIGLHAGWVFIIKLTKNATDTDYHARFGFLIGHYDGVTGNLALVLMAALSGAYYLVFLRDGQWRLKLPENN